MTELLLLFLSIMPGLFFIYWYYSKDIYKKEPWIVIWKSFFWGVATVLPAGLLEASIELPGKDTFVGMLIENFLVIAFTEELCKYLAIRFYSYRNIHFDEMMDGIVYGVAVSSGFATFENIFYVMEHGFAVGMVRAVLSVPSHILEGAIIGYWLAKSKFQNVSFIYTSLVSLSIVVLGHGFFDFVLSYKKAEYFYLALIPVLFLGWLLKIYIKSALDYDLKYIHKLEEPNLSNDSFLESKESTNIYSTHSTMRTASKNSYLSKFISISLYFLSVVCILFATFLLIGFIALLEDGKEEPWTLSIPFVPFLFGLFFVYKARKLAKKS